MACEQDLVGGGTRKAVGERTKWESVSEASPSLASLADLSVVTLLMDFAPAATHESLFAGLSKNEYEYGQEYFPIWQKTV